MLTETGRKITIVAFSALLAAMFALSGCGSSQPASSAASSSASASASSSAASSSSSEAAAESDLVIGEESSSASSVLLTNETGATISSLAVAPAGAEAEPTALMSAGDSWASGKTATVYIEPEGSGVYDVQVGVGDATYVLHSFDVDLIASASVHLDGDVAYVTYEQFGNEVSTLDAETERVEADAAAAAEAEAAAAAEAEAEAQAAVQETYTYDNTSTNTQPAQSGDSCVEGGVALR